MHKTTQRCRQTNAAHYICCKIAFFLAGKTKQTAYEEQHLFYAGCGQPLQGLWR